jgi:PKD repeat protein
MMRNMKRIMVFGIIVILLFGLLPGCLIPRENVPPVPYLTASATFIDVEQEVVFSANLSKDKDGEIVRYFWIFDDGENETGKYVTHKYDRGGNFTVVLIITDNDGKKALQTMTVHVNWKPRPKIEMQLPAYIHEPVYFYSNGSSDEDGYVDEYFWDFGDGTNKSGMHTSHIYSEKKPYRVTLTVTDNDGAKAATSLLFNISYRTYLVEWKEESLVINPENGELLEGESELFSSKINVLNLTRVRFNLTWTDNKPFYGNPPLPQGEPNDDFLLNITSPDEEFFEKGPSSSEKINIYAPKTGTMNQIPQSFEIESESKQILKRSLAPNHTSDLGTGDWTVNITLINAGGRLGEPNADFGEDWNFNVICRYYYSYITKL